MNKTSAHIVLAVFDIAALAACYYVFTEWKNIGELISTNSNSVSMQSHFGFYAILIMVPTVHAMSVFRWPDYVKKWCNRLLVAQLLLLTASAFALDLCLEDKLRSAGYHYCPMQSEAMSFSEFKTYRKDNSSCSE